MKLDDFLDAIYRLGLEVGEHWTRTHDPSAYRLAERLFQVRRETRRELERRGRSVEAATGKEP